MISLPTNFQSSIIAGEINKILYVRLYYSATEYTSFSSKSIDIDNNLSFGAIVNYSPSRSTWNWDGNNNVTITTPTLSIANIEIPDGYRFIDDVYDNNYLGKKCQIYIGFEAYSSTVSDMVKIFDGTIDDIEFNVDANDINIVLRGQNLPKVEIQGRLVNYEKQLLGNVFTPSLSSIDSQNVYLPIAFGRQLFAPTVAIRSSMEPEDISGGYWRYVASDYYTVSANSAITATVAATQYTNKWFFKGGNEERNLITIEDEDFYVPVMERGYNYNYDPFGESLCWIQSLSGIQMITFTNSSTASLTSSLLTQERFNNVIPYRLIYSTSALYKSLANWSYTGNIASIFDGNNTTYFLMNMSPTATNGYVEFRITTRNSFYENYRSNTYDNGLVLFKNRMIHTNSNRSDAIEATVYKDETAVESNPLHYLYIEHKASPTDSGGRTEQFVSNTNQWVHGGYQSSTNSSQWRNCSLGDYSGGTSTGDFSGTLKFSNSRSYNNGLDEFDEQNPLYEFWGISRDSSQFNYYTIAWITNYPNKNHSKYYNINWGFRGEQALDYDNIHLATNGTTISIGQLLSNTASTSLYRPYHYIELMLRYATSATHSNFSNNWLASSIDNKWENLLYTNRDYSGFSIREKITLVDFLKEYLKYEPFTVYKNENGQYDIICLKESYESSDVQYTMNFNDCTSFELSYSDLEKVAWKINNLSTEYNTGLNLYSNEREYKIKSTYGGTPGVEYSYTYYGDDSDRFVIDKIEKKYTSQSKPEGVNYGGNSYYIRQPHLSETGYPPSANTTNYTLADDYDNSYLDWEAGINYSQCGSEHIAIAKYILNQFGNRHRIVKFSTPNYEAFKLQLGDIIKFSNVPYKCLGLEFSGWNGNTATLFVDNVNGQRVYAYFMISSITKYQDRIEVECFNLHKLDNFTIESNGTNYKAKRRKKGSGIAPEYEDIR